MEQEHRELSEVELERMRVEQMPSEEARETERADFDKLREKQKEKFADAANIEAILDGFESSRSGKDQDEFAENFENIRSQLKPYFEKYGVPEPACFKDIEAGDTLQEIYYDVKLAGYGLLREKMSR